jgi:hypothetical protein
MTVARLSVPDLAQALREGACTNGDWDRVAAVQLVIDHESWLYRADFRRFVKMDGRTGSAWLDLRGLADWVDSARASSSETAILRLTCLLVGATPDDPLVLTEPQWSLKSILRPLGQTNAALAVEAIRYAALGPGRPARTGAPGVSGSPC